MRPQLGRRKKGKEQEQQTEIRANQNEITTDAEPDEQFIKMSSWLIFHLVLSVKTKSGEKFREANPSRQTSLHPHCLRIEEVGYHLL
jgi:hypothetical protein